MILLMSKAESVNQAVASAPPAIISSLAMAGVSLQDWVLLATLGWLGMQMAWFVYRRIKDFMNGKPTE